jgi:hypothetical protein
VNEVFENLVRLNKERRVRRWLSVVPLYLGLSFLFGEIRAHETDQYTVAQGRQYANLGPLFTEYFIEKIQAGADAVNAKIIRAKEHGAPPAAIAALQDPEVVVDSVYAQFPSFVTYIDDLDRMLNASAVRQRFPGLVVTHRPSNWIYSEMFLLDVRALYKFWGSSTILIGETYLGTDKIGHFVHNGA